MIIRTRNRGDVELRAFALTDMVRWGYAGLRGSSLAVSPAAVKGVPALHRAARIKAEALASLRLRVWKGDPPMRTRVDNTWQARLFAREACNAWQSRFVFWETVGESMAYRNNAYIWKNVDPLSMQIVDWWALHPDQVSCKNDGTYEVDVRTGFMDPVGRGDARYHVDTSTILHIRGHGEGGTYEAPSPIQIFREALSSPIERQRHEARMWQKGTALRLAVKFPQGISKDQADEFRETWRESYEGSDGESTAVIGGGAEIMPISMTAKDAEYVALSHLTVEDAERIMGVPSELLGLRIGQVPTNLEEIMTRWFRFGLAPELERIESQLAADFELFGAARTYPGFEAESVVRGDLATEDAIDHARIQDGRLLVNEWRNKHGLDPVPGGDVPQITPVGGAPNPGTPAPSSNGNGSREARGRADTPSVHVYVPKQDPPTVNVEMPGKRKINVEHDASGLITSATVDDG